MKQLFDIKDEDVIEALKETVSSKKAKMVLANSASAQREPTNKASMKKWVKSSPFFATDDE